MLKRTQFEDFRLMTLQQDIETAINDSATDITKGRGLTGLSLTTSPQEIAHKLGRAPIGFVVTDLNANAVVFRTDWDDRTITLQASAACTASVWVF